MVIGHVVHAHVSDAVLLDDYKIDVVRLHPMGRLAGGAYCRVTDRFEVARPVSRIRKT